MKILILTSNYPRKNALSNGIFIHRQVKALQQLGVECHVLLLHNWYPPLGSHRLHTYWKEGHKKHSTFFDEYEGVPIHSIPIYIPIPNFLSSENHYDRDARSIINYIKNNSVLQGADWIYAHFLTENAFVAAKIKDKLQVKMAAIARGDDVHEWPEKNVSLRKNFPLIFEKTDLLLANSRNLGNDAKKWMEQGKERNVEVVYNGVDCQKFYPAESAEEKLVLRAKYKMEEHKRYLVCIATPVILKGWNELLSSLQTLGDKFNGWELLMISEKRENRDTINLQKAGNDLGLGGKIRRMINIMPDHIAEILRAADAFVLPSYNEGMSNALLEAMSSGLACVVTDVGGHNEVIESGNEGILIAPRSVSELTLALEQIIDNKELRQTMGERARQKMLTVGDYTQNAKKLLDLFTTY